MRVGRNFRILRPTVWFEGDRSRPGSRGIPFVDVFAEINSVSLAKKCADFSRLAGPFLGQHPLIIGGDICFWDNLVKPLKLLINRAIKNGTKRVVLTDPGRPPFYEL